MDAKQRVASGIHNIRSEALPPCACSDHHENGGFHPLKPRCVYQEQLVMHDGETPD